MVAKLVPASSMPPVITPNARTHFAQLDGMRGLLSLAVVLLHFGFNSFADRVLGWRGVEFGLSVDVFFLLSGFVLTHTGRNSISAWQFVGRRFMRLAPIFYITTLASILMLPDYWHWSEIAFARPLTGHDPANFPSWSVTWEFYLPVLAVFFYADLPENWVRPVLFGALATLGLADVAVAQGSQLELLRAAAGLLAGNLLYRSGLRLNVPTWPMFVSLGLIMAAARYLPAIAVLLPFIACACILAGLQGRSMLARGPALFLGRISYSLYLVHIPVLQCMVGIGGNAVNANPIAKVAGIAFAVIVSWMLHILIEKPAMRLGRHWFRAKGPST